MVTAVIGLLFGRDGGGGEIVGGVGIFGTEYYGFVHREPVGDFVSIAGKYYFGVGNVVFNDVWRKPSAVGILEEEGKIPLQKGVSIGGERVIEGLNLHGIKSPRVEHHIRYKYQ